MQKRVLSKHVLEVSRDKENLYQGSPSILSSKYTHDQPDYQYNLDVVNHKVNFVVATPHGDWSDGQKFIALHKPLLKWSAYLKKS